MSGAPLYFAYGSNLDVARFDAFCREKGFPSGALEPIGAALLPDRELAFTRLSERWRGGVLDVRGRRGQVVHGMLFRVREPQGWRALDRKEGANGDPRRSAYRRLDTVALRPDGSAVPVRTYEVCKPEPFVAPSAPYLRAVRDARKRLGLDVLELDRAATNDAGPCCGSIFVYGTLLRGEERHHLLRAHPLRSVLPAECTGELVDSGEYPGLRPGRAGWVRGELATFDELGAVLEELDDVEGFNGFESRDSHLFERRYIEARVGDGDVQQAWVYVLAAVGRDSVIESGCWRTHRGRAVEQLSS